MSPTSDEWRRRVASAAAVARGAVTKRPALRGGAVEQLDPVSGWVAVAPRSPVVVELHVNGRRVASVAAAGPSTRTAPGAAVRGFSFEAVALGDGDELTVLCAGTRLPIAGRGMAARG